MEERIYEIMQASESEKARRSERTSGAQDATLYESTAAAVKVSEAKAEKAIIEWARHYLNDNAGRLLAKDRRFRAALIARVNKESAALEAAGGATSKGAALLKRIAGRRELLRLTGAGALSEVAAIRTTILEESKAAAAAAALEAKREKVNAAAAYIAEHGLEAAIREGYVKL